MLARFRAALTYAKLIATFTVASLVVVAAPAFGASDPGGRRWLQAKATTLDSWRVFHCQKRSAPYNCYGPAQIRTAYNVQALIDAGKDGSGQTITIIDSFQNPTMANDLASFDSAWGLPPPPSFQTIAPFGLTPFNPSDPNQVGWSGEIALDVEWAHAIAPGAKIVLALAPSDADADQIRTERYVVQHRIGAVLSMSFGEAERCMTPSLQHEEHSLFGTATSQGFTLLAAAGDYGAAQLTCDGTSFIKAVSIPASDPHVTGVGGTNLVADLKTGAYDSESVWNEPVYPLSGGGGFSSLYSRPAYQSGVVTVSMRGVPDVAYSASSTHGVVVAWGSSGSPGEYRIFDGTSVGTPQWAAIVSIADQLAGHGLGNVNPTLYALGQSTASGAVYHDITVGNNTLGGISGYAAVPRWDAASGWGSPIASDLVAALASH